MHGLILGTISWIVLSECTWIQDLLVWYRHWNNLMDSVSWMKLDTRLTWWYHSWKYLMDNVRWVQLNTGHTRLVSSLELFDGLCYPSSIGCRTYMGGIILGTIWWIVLAEWKLTHDLHGWYHYWNYLMVSVIWVQLDTGFTRVVSSF
jgi:hypothetical protein